MGRLAYELCLLRRITARTDVHGTVTIHVRATRRMDPNAQLRNEIEASAQSMLFRVRFGLGR